MVGSGFFLDNFEHPFVSKGSSSNFASNVKRNQVKFIMISGGIEFN